MTGMGELAMFRWDTNIREYQTWVLLVLGVYSGLIFGKFVFGGSGSGWRSGRAPLRGNRDWRPYHVLPLSYIRYLFWLQIRLVLSHIRYLLMASMKTRCWPLENAKVVETMCAAQVLTEWEQRNADD